MLCDLDTAKSNGATKVYCKIESLGGLKTVNKLNLSNLRFVDASGYIDADNRQPIEISYSEVSQRISQQGGSAEIGVIFDL